MYLQRQPWQQLVRELRSGNTNQGIFLTKRMFWSNPRLFDKREPFPSLCTWRWDSTPAVLKADGLPFTKAVYFPAFSPYALIWLLSITLIAQEENIPLSIFHSHNKNLQAVLCDRWGLWAEATCFACQPPRTRSNEIQSWWHYERRSGSNTWSL